MRDGDGRLARFAALPWATWGAALLLGFGLKLHYSRAGARELEWILGPTARLVGLLRGEELALLPGGPRQGWAPPDGAYVIAPACAGVNFLVLVLAVSVLGFAHRLATRRARLAWLGGALAGAWGVTIAVNTVRILAAIELYRVGEVAGISAAGVHRLLGVVVYLGALWGVYAVLDRWTLWWVGGVGSGVGRATADGRAITWFGAGRATAGRPYIGSVAGPRVPVFGDGRWVGWVLVLGLYLGMTVGVPLLHAFFRGGDGRMAWHAMIVTLATLGAAGLAILLRLARRLGRGRGST